MTTRTYKPADAAEQTAFVLSRCRDCARQIGCTILADARPLDETDPDYPAELVVDDLGRPSCTAFEATMDREANRSMGLGEAWPPAVTPVLDPMPLPAVEAAGPARRKKQKTLTIRPDQDVRSITIVTRTARDGTNLSSTIRLQLAGSHR